MYKIRFPGIIIIRQKTNKRPEETGRTWSLFVDDEMYRNYRYSAYIINNEYAAMNVCRNHRHRGDAENKTKALKADFGAESFSLKEFYPTEADLLFQ